LQGNLHLREGELRFLAGGAYQTARYDLQTGKCLNTPHDEPNSRFATAFYPYFPEYGKYLSLQHRLPDGRALVYNASYDGARHSKLALLAPLPPGAPKAAKQDRSGRPQAPAPKAIWLDASGRKFSGFAVGRKALVAAGESGPEDGGAFTLAAINIQDGSDIWRKRLPAMVVKGGVAIDRASRVFVSLENGAVFCFAAAE
jgi:hypothetical protein